MGGQAIVPLRADMQNKNGPQFASLPAPVWITSAILMLQFSL